MSLATSGILFNAVPCIRVVSPYRKCTCTHRTLVLDAMSMFVQSSAPIQHILRRNRGI